MTIPHVQDIVLLDRYEADPRKERHLLTEDAHAAQLVAAAPNVNWTVAARLFRLSAPLQKFLAQRTDDEEGRGARRGPGRRGRKAKGK